MQILGNVDRIDRTAISGWVGDTDHPTDSLIVVLMEGDKVLACTLAAASRPDVEPQFGDSSKGFTFNLADIRPSIGDCRLLVVPLSGLSMNEAAPFKAVEIMSALSMSQERWKGAEPPADRTFGMMMEGTEFFRFVPRENLGKR